MFSLCLPTRCRVNGVTLGGRQAGKFLPPTPTWTHPPAPERRARSPRAVASPPSTRPRWPWPSPRGHVMTLYLAPPPQRSMMCNTGSIIRAVETHPEVRPSNSALTLHWAPLSSRADLRLSNVWPVEPERAHPKHGVNEQPPLEPVDDCVNLPLSFGFLPDLWPLPPPERRGRGIWTRRSR